MLGRGFKSSACIAFVVATTIVMLQCGCKHAQSQDTSEESASSQEKAMISLDSIHFDTSGWKISEKSKDTIRWEDGKPEFLSLHYFPVPPDIPCELGKLKELRDCYRTAIGQAGGGLVSLDVLNVKVGTREVPCLRNIVKVPQSPSGMLYIGSLTFPFADFSYVIKVQCFEEGITGMRDAVVADRLMGAGDVKLDPKTGGILGWAQDPYEPSFKGPALKNQSEDEKYDSQFPEHPLSRARAILARASETVNLDDSVLSSPPFSGPQR